MDLAMSLSTLTQELKKNVPAFKAGAAGAADEANEKLQKLASSSAQINPDQGAAEQGRRRSERVQNLGGKEGIRSR